MKILWLVDTEGWAYENRYQHMRLYSEFDNIQIIISGLSNKIIYDMIEKINPDIVIAQNPYCYRFIPRCRASILLLAGNRLMNGWKR